VYAAGCYKEKDEKPGKAQTSYIYLIQKHSGSERGGAMNISSVVVETSPAHMKEVIDTMNFHDLCEVHFKEPGGRIVATIEGNSIREQVARLSLIQKIPNVLSANMMFSYCEEELTDSLSEINGV
jgi:nitrate reductase NapD